MKHTCPRKHVLDLSLLADPEVCVQDLEQSAAEGRFPSDISTDHAVNLQQEQARGGRWGEGAVLSAHS